MSTVVHIHLQDVPEGGPSFITVDFSKLDLSKLMEDAAKYHNARVPVEMDFWRSLDRLLQELHPLPYGDNVRVGCHLCAS